MVSEHSSEEPDDHALPVALERMNRRRAAFLEALPEDLISREDELPARIRAINANAQSKLGRIYSLVDEFSTHRAPYVACKQGCSDCCRMNVQIWSAEAERITRATGRRHRVLAQSIAHEEEKFAGQDCPFLEGNACSIYEHRPLVCRNHASFDVDAHWCAPARMNTLKAPMIELGGVKQALTEVLKQAKPQVLADIRDFFPSRSGE